MFERSRIPRLCPEDLEKSKPDLDFTDTISMMAELEQAKEKPFPGKNLVSHETVEVLMSQVLKLTKMVQKQAEIIKTLQERQDVNDTALFAYTDKNDLGQRGLYHQVDDVKRLVRAVLVGVTAIAGFIGWLLKYVLPAIINSGAIK